MRLDELPVTSKESRANDHTPVLGLLIEQFATRGLGLILNPAEDSCGHPAYELAEKFHFGVAVESLIPDKPKDIESLCIRQSAMVVQALDM